MIVLQAHNLSKNFGDKSILKKISLAVNEKERLGIVGVNGSGKTTLLRCLTGEIVPDEGEVSFAGLKTVGYLEQLPDSKPGTTAWEAVMDGFTKLIEQRRLLHSLEQEMSQAQGDLSRIMDRYARVTEEYERADGYACENYARRILAGLGFSPEEYDKPLDVFSGGQKTRLNLGRLLAISPDILMLDEPTNHLDIGSVEWLEDFLKSYPGTVLVVSHDRMFLDRVATRIVEAAAGKLRSYNGNYSNYLKLKARDDQAAMQAYDKQQEYIQKTEDYIRRFKAGIKSKQARGRQLQLQRLEKLDLPVQDRVMGEWNVKMNQESGQDVLSVNSVKKAFGDLTIFSDAGMKVHKGEKIALVGPNGCGKTTLLKMISGELNPDAGEIRLGSRVDMAYFSQEHEDLTAEYTLLEEILYNFDMTVEEIRTCLGRMLFREDEVFKQVGDLSGGERGRLALLKVILSGANFLLLDEPTNHLDIASCEAVEHILGQFPGTILLVSHDRYFIDQVADKVIAVEDSGLQYYWGNYSYYREKLQEKNNLMEAEKRLARKQKESFGERVEEKEQQRLQRKLRRELDDTEAQIETLETRKTELAELLSAPDTYEDIDRSRSLTSEYQQTEKLLTEAYARWEELTEEIG